MIELMISAAILAIVMAGATGALLATNQAYARGMGLRQAREQGTAAMDALEKAVRMAGYGIDPQLAFDFDYYKCTLGSTAGAITQSTNCGTATRDSITQADELVVHYRNPYYSTNATTGCSGSTNLIGNTWAVTAVTSASGSRSVSLSTRGTETFYKGQILQLICQDATTYTYAMIKTAPTVNACGTSTTIALEDPIGGGSGSPFTRSDLLSSSCFGAGSAKAFVVNRLRFFIHQDTSNPALPRPFLMLDQGMDIAGASGAGPDGALDDNDLLPIAADVEDLQIAYQLDQVGILALPSTPLSPSSTYVLDKDTNGIWGDTSGTAEQLTAVYTTTTPNVAGAFTAADTASSGAQSCTNVTLAPYKYPCLFDKSTLEVGGALVSPYRWTPWTGNIALVRLNVVTRSSSHTTTNTGYTTTTNADVHYLAPLENRAQVDLTATGTWYANTNPASYQHSYYSGAVRPTNLVSNGLFLF